ncbi:hypothetical protein HGO21_16875 [Acinetobacter sp. CUI P1]|nr:hypothetical protein [Acinetobacter sp. CUI P1]
MSTIIPTIKLSVDPDNHTIIRKLIETDVETFQNTHEAAVPDKSFQVAVLPVSTQQSYSDAQRLAYLFAAAPAMAEVLYELHDCFDFFQNYKNPLMTSSETDEVERVFAKAWNILKTLQNQK